MFTNKLQLGSVPKINGPMQNWHQLETLSSFMEAMVILSMNSVDLFKANGLLQWEHDMVQLSLWLW